ncbi:FtsX-like permease family protein [Bacillus mangrovi]|uniref:FtsX-like permease family protein n=1 Tax=Metabacillus mangrovi TaxID=1491830 RepID=A0A7X2S786_9BACI|nr:ABC transporter permease [Metabacillus mangrovi]MTH54491.1 FtsX-like permease family protein [Metabacillus mangrovi]
MKFKDQVAFVRQNMKKNRLRVFMTILATTMGCAFLIVLASIGFGFQKTATDEIQKQQLLTEVKVEGKEDKEKGALPVSSGMIEDIEKTEGIKAVVKRNQIDLPVTAKLKERSGENFSSIITDMDQEKKANLTLDRGRMPEKADEIVVGYHFGNMLLTDEERKQLQAFENNPEGEAKQPAGYTDELLNKEVVFIYTDADGKDKTYTFTIAGVAKKPARDYLQDTNVMIDDRMLKELAPLIDPEFNPDQITYSTVNAYAESIGQVDGLTKALKEKGYLVYSITEELESMNLFFNAFKAGLIFVGTVAVLIASIGIFNTMTMAVTERTQQIGIMKAIGAQPKMIRRLFLMECAWIGVAGAAIGVLLSYGISFAANQIIPMILESAAGGESIDMQISYIPVSLVLIASAISIGVAILSGLRPAVKATNINVLSALRREM